MKQDLSRRPAMPALPALVAPLASALAAALAHRSATQRGCGAAARPAGCPFDVPGIAGAACPFVRGSTERKPGLHRLSAGGRWIRTIGPCREGAGLYCGR